jgi:hypothetical protein
MVYKSKRYSSYIGESQVILIVFKEYINEALKEARIYYVLYNDAGHFVFYDIKRQYIPSLAAHSLA